MAKKGSRKRNYVTKRVFKVAVGAAVRKASREAMNSMGYVVKAEDGWVVREDSDGNKRRIAKINKTRGAIALD
jgi:hypothetical protein